MSELRGGNKNTVITERVVHVRAIQYTFPLFSNQISQNSQIFNDFSLLKTELTTLCDSVNLSRTRC